MDSETTTASYTLRLKEKMIHYPQSERGTTTARHLLIAYAPLRWRGE